MPSLSGALKKPTEIDYNYAPYRDAVWEIVAPNLAARDLGIGNASKGVATSGHFKAGGAPGTVELAAAVGSEFYFLFVLKGHAKFNGQELAVGSSCIVASPTTAPKLEFSSDFEAFDFVGKSLLTVLDRSCGPFKAAPKGEFISHDTPQNFVVGNGPRRFFTYRDLGAKAVMGNRIHIQAIRLAQPVTEGTGWHIHSMDQFFFQVSGEQKLYVDGHGINMCTYGDVMAIGAGTRHNVDSISPSYCAVEICIPAEYETIDTDPGSP
jgi:mannose-6-phosphate isomerase-like protein (cupin superfamily)